MSTEQTKISTAETSEDSDTNLVSRLLFPRYSMNWIRGAVNVYEWEPQCQHHAIPCFAGYKKITGEGPKFVKVGPGAQLYGCFEDGGARNFYGSHEFKIVKL